LITYLLDKPLGNRGFLVLQLKIKHTMAERSIVDVGNYLKRFYRVGENPAFGGVGGGHSPTGYHPKGLAIDVTDWRPDMAPAYEGGPKLDWKTRTGNLSWRAKQLGVFNEALGPGDKGHDTHVHLALEGKKFLTDPQLEWLATGRYKTPEGKLTDVMPGASTQPISSENPGSVNTQEFLVGYLLGTGFAGEPKESGATKMKRQLVQQLLQPAQTINPMELIASLPNPYAV
jgi:hypothetical protein